MGCEAAGLQDRHEVDQLFGIELVGDQVDVFANVSKHLYQDFHLPNQRS